MRDYMVYLASFLLGGIFFGVGAIAILWSDAGSPTSALERINKAIRNFKGLYEEN